MVVIWPRLPNSPVKTSALSGIKKLECGQGVDRRARGHAPQSSIEWIFFHEKKLALLGRRACGSLYQKCSVGLKYAKNALAAGAHDAPPSRLHARRSPIFTPLGAQLLWPPM